MLSLIYSTRIIWYLKQAIIIVKIEVNILLYKLLQFKISFNTVVHISAVMKADSTLSELVAIFLSRYTGFHCNTTKENMTSSHTAE